MSVRRSSRLNPNMQQQPAAPAPTIIIEVERYFFLLLLSIYNIIGFFLLKSKVLALQPKVLTLQPKVLLTLQPWVLTLQPDILALQQGFYLCGP